MKIIVILLLLFSFFNNAAAQDDNKPHRKLAKKSELRGDAQRTGLYPSVPEISSPASTKQLTSSAEYSKYNNCSKWWVWAQPICKRLYQIWIEGENELYLSGYAWHNRHTYSKSKLRTYNEQAWGGGLGKGFNDEKGNWHGLVVLAFLDSHKNVEPAAGYAYLKIAHLTSNLNVGVGYSILVTQRPDLFKGAPFLGVLPWLSFSYRKVSIMTTYIPGAAGAGNVLYIMGKLKFNFL